MRKPIFFCAWLLILIGCDSGSTGFGKAGKMDWPLFRGDVSLSGYSPMRLPENPVLLWSFKSDSRTVSSPVVLGGTTYWCDRRGRITGVDIDGKQCFDFELKTAVEATPMIHDSTLYIGRIDGFLTAVSIPKKDTLWNFETLGQVSASPNCMDFEGRQAVVFGSYDNFMYCVDSRNGQEINRFESGYYLNGAVALWKGHAIFGGCDSWLRIINCQTGTPTDSLLLDAYVPASPAISGDFCYIGDYSGNIYEIQLEKGKIIHHKKFAEAAGENSSFISVPAVTEKDLFFLTDDRHLNCIDRKSGNLRWKFMLKGNVGESSPLVCGNRVIACTKTGIVSILDTANGTLIWEYDTGEQIVGSPAVIKDHFFILTARGTLFCFK